MQYYLGIDQSKRCTGCVLLNENGIMVDYLLICESVLDNEQLIVSQFATMCAWLERTLEEDDKLFAMIEGLAFGAVGSGKDFLAGLQWYFRTRFMILYNHLGTVPVSMWRSKVLSKDEQREAKAEGKDGLKWAVFNKLPAHVRKQFADYVEEHKDAINAAKTGAKKGSTSKKYVDGMMDLSDAYYIAHFCLSINK